MKLFLLTTLALQLVRLEATPCTYYSDDYFEGCSPGEFCQIGDGACMSGVYGQQGNCHTPERWCMGDMSPVCGCDIVTYANKCAATAAKVNVYQNGCCPGDNGDGCGGVEVE